MGKLKLDTESPLKSSPSLQGGRAVPGRSQSALSWELRPRAGLPVTIPPGPEGSPADIGQFAQFVRLLFVGTSLHPSPGRGAEGPAIPAAKRTFL